MNDNTTNLNEIPVNYYRDHLLQLLTTVHQRYGDLLTNSEQQFITRWQQASEPAQRLLVRLYLRKGPLFFAEKLSYAEVPHPLAALAELAALELIEFNPLAYGFELIQVLPVQQSRQLFESDAANPKKQELLEYWLKDEQLRRCSDWGVTDTLVTPLHYEAMRTFQLLFFGNERQSLTEFVLQDLGIAQYENYPLDTLNRLFSERAEIMTYQAINDAADAFYLLELNKEWHLLSTLAKQVLALQPSNNIKHRWVRLVNRIGYRLEQCGELNLAMQCFATNEVPPARERKIRIHHKWQQYEPAQILLEAIEVLPKSADEVAFYQRFINKNRKALGRPALTVAKPEIQRQSIVLPSKTGPVEQQTAAFLGHCVWLENQLPMAVFGLACWPMLFANVSGVWHHPFQSQPTDLYDPEFLDRRMPNYEHILSQNKAELRQQISQIWQQKQGISNPFVNWKALQLETLLACFDSLSLVQWHGLLKHLFADLKQHRSGFPDLFQHSEHGYTFIEVKGPGDKLQSNQIAWLEVFSRLEINAYVCYVAYET